MKRWMWIPWMMVVLAIPGGSNASSEKKRAEAIAQIEALVRQWEKAYNERDEAALKKIWTKDGELVSVPGGKIAQGREAVLQAISQNQTGPYRGGKLNITPTHIKFIRKKVALVEAKNRMRGLITPGGIRLPPVAHRMVLGVEKVGRAWRLDVVLYYSALPILRSAHPPKLF